MDALTAQLVDFAVDFPGDLLGKQARTAVVTRVVDSIACAVAGAASEPARIAVEATRGYTGPRPATVLGAGLTTTEELAAFANTVMVRCLDWNDGMLAKGGGHPSDMIPAVLAVAEGLHLDGATVVNTIALAYELLGALGSVAPTRDRGFDQGTFMAPSAALAVARMVGLSREQMGQAVSLSVVPHLPLRVTRTGELSMWKGCATASAMHSAIVAVRLAQLGMTGPDQPFEGVSGVFDQATGPFEVRIPAQPGGRLVAELSHLKKHPAETHSQALLDVTPKVRAFAAVGEIASIEIETYWQAYHEIAMHPTRWDPRTRETADHSLPYLLAVALVDGKVTNASFTAERIADPALRPVMRLVSVREDPEFTAEFRPPGATVSGAPRARITVTRHDGERFVEEVSYHRGHAENPMSRLEIDAKFGAAAEGVVAPDLLAAMREVWWAVDDLDDIADALRISADFRSAQ